MLSSEDQQQPPNPAPPSLSAGDHGMRDDYAAQDAPRPPSEQEPYLTPYLGLRARLSQTWINRWTILLLLVLFRTLIALATLDNDLGSARTQALSLCTSVENVGSAMASMPYYMSQGVNELSAAGITKAINGLMEMLIMTVSGVEDIVVFIIDLLTKTYLCLITLAVSGSLHVAVQVAEDVGNFLNSTIQGVGKDLDSAALDFQDAMNGFLSDLDKLSSIFTGKTPTPPSLNLSAEISTLNGLQLPSGYDQGLQTLNASIPTFAQVNNLTQTVLRYPFEEVKKLLNESLPAYTINGSLFPVPAKQDLTFCSDNNGVDDFFDDLVQIERDAKRVFLIVIVLLAVLAMIPMAWREMRGWRFMKKRARLIQIDAFDPLDSVYIASRPYTSTAGLKVAEKLKSPRRQTLVRWVIAYATTVPALFVLSLAVASLLGCLTQYILLKLVDKEVPILENQIIGFADKVITALDDASTQWANGTNQLILDTNAKINHDVFGWVNTTTTAINNTLNTFVDEMVGALNSTFGGTVLYDPILDVLNCLILLKIEGIEAGLAWVSDHAQIDFPLLPNNTFSLGTIDKVAGSKAAILAGNTNGGAADAITDAMYHVTNALYRGIRQEALIATCLLMIWVLVVLMGIARALFLLFRGGNDVRTISPVGHKDGPSGDVGEEVRELHDFLPRVPTYEQATRSPHPLGHHEFSVSAGDNSANMYNGQPYTLTPTPLPTLELTTTTSPILHTGFRSPREELYSHTPNEKMGTVAGAQTDSAIRRPTHVRASSHGDVASVSPSLAPAFPQHPQNPFADTYKRTSHLYPTNIDYEIYDKKNPFADPTTR